MCQTTCPNEEDYKPHINPDTYEGEFFQETLFPKKCFKKRFTSHQNIEVDSDSEPDFTAEPEQEEPKQEEVTDADDLSMVERLRKGGLPHVDAAEPDEHFIHDSDDDDAFTDPGAFIEPDNQHYYQVFNFLCCT